MLRGAHCKDARMAISELFCTCSAAVGLVELDEKGEVKAVVAEAEPTPKPGTASKVGTLPWPLDVTAFFFFFLHTFKLFFPLLSATLASTCPA